MSATFKKLLQLTKRIPAGPDGEDRFDRATRVKVTQFKRGYHRKTGELVCVCRTQTVERAPGTNQLSLEKHVTTVKWLSKKHVHVSCSCGDFAFRWEYNLAQLGAADITYSNGEPASHNYVAVCKHIIRLADFAVRNGVITGEFTQP